MARGKRDCVVNGCRSILGEGFLGFSCERFAKIAPRLPEKLGRFYAGLLASEARHFEHYIALAKSECGVSDAEIESRLRELKKIEAGLIASPDPEFRFHSGMPSAA